VRGDDKMQGMDVFQASGQLGVCGDIQGQRRSSHAARRRTSPACARRRRKVGQPQRTNIETSPRAGMTPTSDRNRQRAVTIAACAGIAE
jgi:hypothetical protein